MTQNIRFTRCSERMPLVQQRGFTLIEIIVVTAIIGIMATFLVGALLQDNDRIAKLEAQRFVTVVAELQDEAVLAGTPFTLQLNSHSYTIASALAESNGSNHDSLIGERHLQDGVALTANISVLDPDLNGANDAPQQQLVLIDTMGEVTPFEALFIGDKLRYRAFFNEEGQLAVESTLK